MNQLDIDPTELRGIGIQVNKLESRTVKKAGRIEEYLSNMKSDPKQNQILFNENTNNKTIMPLKIKNSKCQQSSSAINTHMENNNKSKMTAFLKPKENSSSEKQQSISKTLSHVHQSFVNFKMSEVDPAFLDALPPDLRQEIENDLRSNYIQNEASIKCENTTSTMEIMVTKESSKLYQLVHVDQMKEFIEEWVATECEPKMCDNIMVSKYLCNLIKDGKTEEAYEIIRKLYR